MQVAYRDVELIRDQDGEPYAIALGVSDYADHSSGHQKLADCLGVGRDGDAGLDQHRIAISRKTLQGQMWIKNLKARREDYKDLPPEARLLVAAPGSWELEKYLPDDLSNMLYPRDFNTGAVKPLQTAWSTHGFFIRAFGKDERAFVKRLAKAFQNGDVVLGSSDTLAFGSGPLVVAVASAVPEVIKAAHLNAESAVNEAEEDTELTPALRF